MSKSLQHLFKVPCQNFLPYPSLGGQYVKNINNNRGLQHY